jgi:hypothetical protein
LPALVVYYWVDRPLRFGLGVFVFWLAAALANNQRQQEYLVHRDRSFFGRLQVEVEELPLRFGTVEQAANTQPIVITSRNHGLTTGQVVEVSGVEGNTAANGRWQITVVDSDRFTLDESAGNGDHSGGGEWSLRGKIHRLVHGTTLHGKQIVNPHSPDPLTYYHRTGPLGQVFSRVPQIENCEIAAVGLGTGSVAAYGTPLRKITFYEIDPTVVDIADNPKFFTYLRDCSGGRPDVVLGDARLKLEEHGRAGQYGLIIVDAFSSDAIPMHLLTKEAIELYLSRLRPDGIIALHVSNRYLSLEPVAARIARELGLVGLQINDGDKFDPDGGDDERNKVPGKQNSQWVVLARDAKHFGRLSEPPGEAEVAGRKVPLSSWMPLELPPNTPLWTDDFSNVVSVLSWW